MHKQHIPAQTLWHLITVIGDSAISAVFSSTLMQDNARMAALGRRWLLSVWGGMRIAEDGTVLPG